MGEMADLNDVLVRSTLTVDDGCDWKYWLVWDMRKNFFIHQRINPAPPERPKVSEVKLEPKKTAKRGKRSGQRETARA